MVKEKSDRRRRWFSFLSVFCRLVFLRPFSANFSSCHVHCINATFVDVEVCLGGEIFFVPVIL